MWRRLEHPLVDDVDDCARCVVRQGLRELLRQHERRAQVHVHVQIPGLSRGRCPVVVLEHRSAVDQHAKRPEFSDRARDQSGDLLLAGEIGAQKCRTTSHGANGARDVAGIRLGRVVMQRHVIACLRQIERDGAAQPLCGAGNEGGL